MPFECKSLSVALASDGALARPSVHPPSQTISVMSLKIKPSIATCMYSCIAPYPTHCAASTIILPARSQDTLHPAPTDQPPRITAHLPSSPILTTVENNHHPSSPARCPTQDAQEEETDACPVAYTTHSNTPLPSGTRRTRGHTKQLQRCRWSWPCHPPRLHHQTAATARYSAV